MQGEFIYLGNRITKKDNNRTYLLCIVLKRRDVFALTLEDKKSAYYYLLLQETN